MQYLLLAANVLMLVSGQVLFKMGVSNVEKWNLQTALSLLLNPCILIGFALYGITTVLWLYILSKMPFSIAYPFQSLAYVLGMIVAYFLFKEHVSLTQWIGMTVIVLGVFLISK